MNSYHIKINNKFVKNFIDTDIPQKFRGEWHNNSKQTCSSFELCENINEAKTIEGNINLKSYLELINGILKDNFFNIDKFEVIKYETNRHKHS